MRLLPIAVVLLGSAIPSQQNILYADDASPLTGVGNAFPFGSEGVRQQQLVMQSVLGNTPHRIRDLFVNPRIHNVLPQQVSQIYYGDFEIRMGTTQATALSGIWANNLTNPTVVHRGPLLVRFERDRWIPLGLKNSYLWAPQSPADNLVIDFICWHVIDTGSVPPNSNGYFLQLRASAGNSLPRAYRLGWTAGQPPTSSGFDNLGIKLGFLFDDGNFVAHDGTCVGATALMPQIAATVGAWPQLGSPFDIHLHHGPPGRPAILAFGFNTATSGPYALPLDLTPFGAPGCIVWHDPLLTAAFAVTSLAGDATHILQIPGQAGLSPMVFHATWFCLDPGANVLGLVPSGFGTILL
ncbi:MAG: hypothetical protein KDC98_26090 [Planctomycetes bacterium]|nr:hypothetical protein [Planctomycetota bacterium]